MSEVSVVFSFRAPGRFALTVLAGAIEAGGLERVQLHFPRTTDQIIETVQAELDAGRRVIVAWSFYSPSFPECAEEHAKVRAAESRPFVTVAGGVHATAEPKQTLEAGFDLICVGEGERVVLELIAAVQTGRPLSEVRGCARLEEGRVVQTPKPARIELDEHPPFAAQSNNFGPIELTRGCIYACRFCQTPFFSKARFRHRSLDNIVQWARVLREAERRDLRFISPTSLSYGSDDEHVRLDQIEALLRRTKEVMGPDGRVFFGTFPSEVRPEHVTPEALALIKQYCANDELVIGGQSGSERVLESSKRGHDVAAIVHAAKVALANGFVPNVDFILGLPGEEPGDIAQTVTLMKELGDLGAVVHAHTFMPLPGTPFRDAAPGTVDEATRVELDRLASQRRLFGQWKVQVKIAAELADRRDRSPKGYGSR